MRNDLSYVLLLALSLVLLPAQAAAAKPPDQLIVQMSPHVAKGSPQFQETRLRALAGLRGLPLSDIRDSGEGRKVVTLSEQHGPAVLEALALALATDPDIAYAQVDAIVLPTYAPNDRLFPRQWHLENVSTLSAQAPSYGINAIEAWQTTVGDADFVMAIIDTGVIPHVDLPADRMLNGYDFIAEVSRARDGDGRDPDPRDTGDHVEAGECGEGSPAKYSSWHGTHVTGIAAASADNGIGIAGVNWRSLVLPVRVLGACGGRLSDVLDAIRWSAGLPVRGVPINQFPARVVNLSLSFGSACARAEQDTINAVRAAGTLVIASAGNSAGDVRHHSPASCDGVMAIAASNRRGQLTSYSNHGEQIALIAPGGEISVDGGVLSTLDNGPSQSRGDNSYAYYQGTSMAAPLVVGAASLIGSLRPELGPEDIAAILRHSAAAFPASGASGDCVVQRCGAGLLDVASAVRVAVEWKSTPAPERPPEKTQSGSLSAASLLVLASVAVVYLRRRRSL